MTKKCVADNLTPEKEATWCRFLFYRILCMLLFI
jgi:hypothetical protein